MHRKTSSLTYAYISSFLIILFLINTDMSYARLLWIPRNEPTQNVDYGYSINSIPGRFQSVSNLEIPFKALETIFIS